MPRTAIQLYTLKDLDEPIPETITRVGETTFDGVEFYDAHFDAFRDDDTVRRTVSALDEADLDIAGAHVSINRLDASFDHVVSICVDIGCTTLVIPTYEGEAFTSREGIACAADRIADIAADLDDHGIELLYHNHTFEFADWGSEIAFEKFVDYAGGRFGFQPDVGLATRAGYDALDLLDLVGERAPVVHLTDTVLDDHNRLHVDVGNGVVEIGDCADAASENGVDWFVCENGSTDAPLKSLEKGSRAFESLRNG